MRTTEKIAAEAIAATFGRIDEKTINYAIEIGRTEALAELYLRKTYPTKKLYLLTGSPWNDIVSYINKAEANGKYICTNTAFNEWWKEIEKADEVMTLRGWQHTKLGRLKHLFAKELGKKISLWRLLDFVEEDRW